MNKELHPAAKEETAQQEPTAQHGQTAYKIQKPLHDKITAYLNTRPFSEVDAFLTDIFESDYEAIYITHDGMQQIINYLMKCPHKEVKEIMNEVKEPSSLIKFTVTKNGENGQNGPKGQEGVPGETPAQPIEPTPVMPTAPGE